MVLSLKVALTGVEDASNLSEFANWFSKMVVLYAERCVRLQSIVFKDDYCQWNDLAFQDKLSGSAFG